MTPIKRTPDVGETLIFWNPWSRKVALPAEVVVTQVGAAVCEVEYKQTGEKIRAHVTMLYMRYKA